MNDIPDKELVFEIYLVLLKAYNQRCSKNKEELEVEASLRLTEEAIMHASNFEITYRSLVNSYFSGLNR